MPEGKCGNDLAGYRQGACFVGLSAIGWHEEKAGWRRPMYLSFQSANPRTPAIFINPVHPPIRNFQRSC
jgi:hypothetical protein